MKQSTGWGIFARLWAVMMVIALVPVGVIGYLAYREAQVDIAKSVDATLAKRSADLVSYTELWLDNVVASLQQVASQPEFIGMHATPATPLLAPADPRKPVLEALIGSREYLRAAYVMRSDGWQVVRSDNSQLVMVGDRPYFLDNMKGVPGIQVVISRVTNLPALIVSVPIRNREKIVGGVATASELSTISAQIATARFGDTGYAFIVDKSGKIVAHPETQLTAEQKDMSEHPAFAAMLRGARMPITFIERGETFVAYADTTRHGWTVITQQARAEAYGALAHATSKAGQLIVLALFVVTLLSLVVSRWLSRPIQSLTSVAEQISRGEVDSTIVETQRGDEIGALARAIERLQTSVKLALAHFEAIKAEPTTTTPSDRPPPRASMPVPKAAANPVPKISTAS